MTIRNKFAFDLNFPLSEFEQKKKSMDSSSIAHESDIVSTERNILPERFISNKQQGNYLEDGSGDGNGKAAEHWLLAAIFNFFWVISYFISGSTHIAFRSSWYIVSLLLLKFPKWIIVEANHIHLTIPFSVLVVTLAIIFYVSYEFLKGRLLSEYKNLTSDLNTDSLNSKNSKSSRLLHHDSKDSNTTRRRRYSSGKLLSSALHESHSGINGGDDGDDTFLSSYLDQFLSAIRIFGYLEKPVFHDLTKNMKTQKLDEGEILLLDNSVGFAIVVEGTLDIYHEVEEKGNMNDIDGDFMVDDNQSIYSILKRKKKKYSTSRHGQYNNNSDPGHYNGHNVNGEDEDDDDGILQMRSSSRNQNIPSFDAIESSSSDEESDINDGDSESESESDDESTGFIRLKDGLGKFQLLNTVKAGNPVSSLVNILNLFTSANDNVTSPSRTGRMDSNYTNPVERPTSKLSTSIEESAMRLELGKYSLSPTEASYRSTSNPSNNFSKDNDPLSKSISGPDAVTTPSLPPLNNRAFVIPKVVARAATDCTIAIIPPQAFAKLKAKYPRSASHIIQMILTKLYHVTFQTAHKYLGLTQEIAYTELLLNRTVSYDLPNYLKEIVIDRFKDKGKDMNLQKGFQSPTSSRLTSNFNGNSNNQRTNSRNSQTLMSSRDLRKTRPELSQQSSMIHSPTPITGSRHVVLESRDKYNPGDLLSNVPLSRINLASPSSRGFDYSSMKKESSPQSSVNSRKRSTTGERPRLLKRPSIYNNQSSSRSDALKGNNSNNKDINFTSFSAQEETEDSVVRMALVEAMLTYLGVNKTNMSILPGIYDGAPSEPHSHRASEISLVSSYTSSAAPQTTIRILPKEYAIVSTRKQKQSSKKRRKYKEEISPTLDYEYAKNEFAQAIELQYFKQGTVIVEQDTRGKGLYYVVSGKIDVTTSTVSDHEIFNSTRDKKKKKSKTLFTIESGGIAGYLSSLVSYKSFVTLIAKTDVYVGFLPYQTLEKLCDKYFLIYLRIAESLTSLLTPRMLKLDHALEWLHLNASDTLFNQGDPANGIYVILNGRLRQLRNPELEENSTDYPNDGEEKDSSRDSTIVMGELGQGESFGEVEVLTAMDRISSMVAVRDTELARIPRSLFELLAIEHPSIMIRVSRLVAKKILGQGQANMALPKIGSGSNLRHDLNLTIPPSSSSSIHTHSYGNDNSNQMNNANFRTITILPITSGLPVESFAMKLVHAFKQVGRTTIGLNQRTTLSHLGRHAFDKLAKLKESGYFAELEELYQTVVYIADTPVKSSWTKTCIAQADCVILLARADDSPEIGEYERLLLKSKTTSRTELVLLHNERSVEPGMTQRWLRSRSWVHNHYHIQFAMDSLVNSSNVKDTGGNIGALNLVDKFIQTELGRKTQYNISKLLPESIKMTVENFSSRFMKRKRQYYTPVHRHKDDFLRLARILSGQAIGLVLGGGGARGLSHLGILQALEECGIPIDMIGGTSIGSFVGGLYAKDYDLVPIFGRIKKFAGRISSIWRMLSDFTWPVTSYTTGHEFNRGIWKSFGDTRIEDFWVQYFCNSTNITESVQEIHSYGYAWRYVRASMSLAGLLPPIEDNGSMLLDGGYVDNLPVLEMKARGCNTIFAVDVGSVDDRTPMKYGDSLNGFWIILNRWNPFSKHPNIPTMAEIQVRLGYVSSVNALEKAKRTPGVIYVRPPIENYATLDFGKFEEIYKVGADFGKVFLQALAEEGKMPYIPGSNADLVGDVETGFFLHRRNSI